MDNRTRRVSERKEDVEAPELHNSEQDDEQWQAQSVAEDALRGEARRASPLDSRKDDTESELMDDSTQDLVDHMRDMEQSGRIDMSAYRGEPNHDDNDEWLDEEDDSESAGVTDA